MAALDHSTFGIAAAKSGFFVRVANGLRVLYRGMQNRSRARHLAELSDWELADIGLTRDDVTRAFRHRATIDPTPELQAIARSRSSLEDAARRVA